MTPKFSAGQRLIHYGKEVEVLRAIVDDFGSLNQYEIKFEDGSIDIVYENTLQTKVSKAPPVEDNPPTVIGNNGEVIARMRNMNEPPDPPTTDILTLRQQELKKKEKALLDFFQNKKRNNNGYFTYEEVVKVKNLQDLMDLFGRK
jgi:hypothetical protein